jgi:hypothetical protein
MMFRTPSSPRQRRRRLRLGAVGLAVAATAATACACANDRSSADDTTVPTTAVPPTTVASTTTSFVVGSAEDKAAITRTLNEYWNQWDLALDPPDPNRPEIRAVAKGQAFEMLSKQIATYQGKGWHSHRENPTPRVMHHTVEQVDQTKAVAQSCITDDATTFDANNNPIDTSVHVIRWSADLERVADGWIVTGQRQLRIEPEGNQC